MVASASAGQTIVVFDTNVLVSGLGGWRGVPYRCLELAGQGVVHSITCRQLLDELTEILEGKLVFTPAQCLAACARVAGFSRLVTVSGSPSPQAPDPDDNVVLQCADLGRATHIITGDRRHLLPMRQYRDIAIVSPAQFLALMKSR